MLSVLDETLMHQVPLTFDEALSSDHRFFDRMVVGTHSPDGTKIVVGMAAYKNMNVFEAFACVQKGNKQYNLRRSRVLRPQLAHDLDLPPISIDVVEPLQALHLALSPGDDWLTSFELDWNGNYPTHQEKPHFGRAGGRIYQDYQRFDQLGVVKGHLSVEGERIEISDWFGWRDHSWGVRPGVGNYEPDTGTGEAPALSVPGADGSLLVMLWFSAEGIGGNFHVIEDGHGNQFGLDGDIKFPQGTGKKPILVTSIEHDIHFIPGTRVYDRANLLVTTADGQTYEIEAEAAGRPWVFMGTGYSGGYNDGKGLGVFRGEDLIETDIYDISAPEEAVLPDGRRIAPVHREQPVNLSVNGAKGYGYMPLINHGRIRRYGLGE